MTWYEFSKKTAIADKIRFERSERSKQWAGPLPKPGPQRLYHILQHCKSICLAHGLPNACEFSWASIGKAAGRAGFHDGPNSFEKPFINLDSSILESGLCPQELILDVYCGVALHEVSHILNSRACYTHLKKLDRIQSVFRNLWEDEFVEQEVRRESPGFIPYLYVAKDVLIRNEIQKIRWDSLPDLDRVNLILYTFIRAPELIRDVWKAFLTVDGTNVFNKLLQATNSIPVSEMDFQRAFERCDEIWAGIQIEYEKKYKRLQTGGVSEQQAVGVRHQMLSTLVDNIIIKYGEIPAQVVDELFDLAINANHGNLFGSASKDVGERLLELACNVESTGDVMFGRAGHRFGPPELIEIDRKANQALLPISSANQKAIQGIADKSTKGNESNKSIEKNCKTSQSTRSINGGKIHLSNPSANLRDQNRYHKAVKKTENHVKAIRAALPKVSENRNRRLDGTLNGSLDRRKLWSYRFNDHVFFQNAEHKPKQARLAIGLLLDESGSMDIERDGKVQSKGGAVLDVAALLSEALKNSRSGIELEIYSHNYRNGACALKYLFGKQQTNSSAIGCYKPSGRNHDAEAIAAATKLLRENTKNTNRLLIVISDGAPSNGEPGIEQARTAVRRSRRSGVQVIGIAIEAFAAEKIYGETNTLVFDDLDTLSSQLKKLLLRVTR